MTTQANAVAELDISVISEGRRSRKIKAAGARHIPFAYISGDPVNYVANESSAIPTRWKDVKAALEI